ncbi:MAG: hypothetical protein ACLP1X_02425 [Polyangiaceae bacterium]
MWRSRPNLGRAIIGTLLGSICVLSACSQTPQTGPGQLVVAIDTDMALPDQIDEIELTVIANGTTELDLPMSVGPGLDAQQIPATLTIVAGSDPTEPVTVRVIGWKDGVPRTLRQLITTIPTDRVAILRMPVQWLCDGTAQPTSGSGDGGSDYQSACGAGATCEAGECVPSQVSSTTLAAYQPQAVFGGGSAPTGKAPTAGTCFDTVACLVSGSVETPDDQCTVPTPTGGAGVNVGLRVADDGICDTTGTTCFVPLDGDSAEGWMPENGRIALPTAVCTKLRTGLVAGVVVSTTCPTKTDSEPPCGAWSSVAPADDASAGPADASVPPTVPSLVASAVPDGGTASACCPLMADSSRLYTCLCNGAGPVQIVAVDASTGSTTAVGSFTPQSLRARYAAVLAGGEVYWIDRTTGDAGTTCPVFATSVADGGTGSPIAIIDGDVYDGADLLADSANLYAMADSVSGLAATASPVQLLSIARGTGVVTPLDTGGAQTILQFTQDMNALYVGVDTDVAQGDASVERVSRVVQFPKAGGPSATMAESTLTTPNAAYGGYIGLADDGTTLFALFQQTPAADGTVDTQVLKLGAAGTTPSVAYDEVLNPTISTLRILGAVDGAVVLARDVAPQPDGGDAAYGSSASESSVLVIPAGGGAPRIIASFVNDSPIFELQAPAFSADTFWVNGSGRIFSLPAGALR